MKKQIFCGIVAMVLAIVTAYNVSLNSRGVGLSDIALANIEALADIEFFLPIGDCIDYGCLLDFDHNCNVYLLSTSGEFYIYGGTCKWARG